MDADRRSVRLFSLGADINGEPTFIESASFKSLKAEELKDIERWIKREPELLGEELLIIAAQFSNWDKTSDRPDLLALDRQGKLVVVEIKRDKSGKEQDLQGIRYASYASTLSSDQVVELLRTYEAKEHDKELTTSEATESLNEFIEADDIEALDDDENPRIILVASGFQPGVTSTVLWLRRTFTMDVSCIQIQPYELQGEIVLTSTTLIPLPEAADYEVRLQSKRLKSASKKRTPLDKGDAEKFIASIPTGHWTSYGDVAAAGGSPDAAQSVGNWLRSEDTTIPLVYRVLNRDGEVSGGWKTKDPSLPPTPEEVEAKLNSEGVKFEEGRASQDQRWSPEDWLNQDDNAGH